MKQDFSAKVKNSEVRQDDDDPEKNDGREDRLIPNKAAQVKKELVERRVIGVMTGAEAAHSDIKLLCLREREARSFHQVIGQIKIWIQSCADQSAIPDKPEIILRKPRQNRHQAKSKKQCCHQQKRPMFPVDLIKIKCQEKYQAVNTCQWPEITSLNTIGQVSVKHK